MTQDRGIWEIENNDNVIKFKIDKAEDSLRRRMRLRKDAKAPFRQYLSATAFQEKMRSRMISSQSPSLSPTSKTNTTIDFTELTGRISVRKDSNHESDIGVSQPNKNNDFYMIPKEEMLSGIQEKVDDSNVNKKRSTAKWRFYCEKIALKGAVFGDIEVTDTFIFFSPVQEERPDTVPYRFGALVRF